MDENVFSRLAGDNVVTLVSVFFFQAEDGIRDLTVTGVQTCALPIFSGQFRIDRERQNARGLAMSHGIVLRLMAKALVGFDEGECDRIMDFGADPALDRKSVG